MPTYAPPRWRLGDAVWLPFFDIQGGRYVPKLCGTVTRVLPNGGIEYRGNGKVEHLGPSEGPSWRTEQEAVEWCKQPPGVPGISERVSK